MKDKRDPFTKILQIVTELESLINKYICQTHNTKVKTFSIKCGNKKTIKVMLKLQALYPSHYVRVSINPKSYKVVTL